MSETTNNVVEAETKVSKTQLAKVNDIYLPMITDQLETNNITFSEYAKSCVINAISAINGMLDVNGTSWGDAQLDTNGITQILLNVAALQLNATANPRECYFQIRKVSVKNADGDTVWKKKIEFGIEGNGYDALVSRFGRDVKKVYPFWEVREGDDFTYPTYNGLEMSPPQWTPKGDGKVVRIVYPILHTDNTIHFYIAERKDVKKNLIAHINNNLMNETFGFVTGQKKDSKGKLVDRTRYDATEEEKGKIAEKKKEILTKAKELDLEMLLDSADFDKYISPAWKEHSESMIIRKMRNNIVKKIPKSFETSLENEIFNENTDEAYKMHKAEMIETENTPLIETDFEDLNENEQVDKNTGEIKPKPEF